MKYLKNIHWRWFKGDTMKIPVKTVLMSLVVVAFVCAFAAERLTIYIGVLDQ